MRKLKFRAWNFKEKKFHYVEILKEGLEFSSSDDMKSKDIEIVEQYVGQVDQQGIEIYEGDILATRFEGAGIIVGVMNFDDTRLQFGCDAEVKGDVFAKFGQNYEHHVKGKSDRPLIVGNVHENPELITN